MCNENSKNKENKDLCVELSETSQVYTFKKLMDFYCLWAKQNFFNIHFVEIAQVSHFFVSIPFTDYKGRPLKIKFSIKEQIEVTGGMINLIYFEFDLIDYLDIEHKNFEKLLKKYDVNEAEGYDAVWKCVDLENFVVEFNRFLQFLIILTNEENEDVST